MRQRYLEYRPFLSLDLKETIEMDLGLYSINIWYVLVTSGGQVLLIRCGDTTFYWQSSVIPLCRSSGEEIVQLFLHTLHFGFVVDILFCFLLGLQRYDRIRTEVRSW